MTVVDQLKTARRRIARKWGQGAYYKDGAYCAVGALEPTGDYVERYAPDAFGLLSAIVAPDENVPMSGHVIQWNDQPQRTKAEVLEAFDVAIAHAEGAGI
jgi:hypothetical protein